MTLEERVRSVRDTLERESAAWGRVPRLIAVTKYSTAEQILPLHDLGVADIGADGEAEEEHQHDRDGQHEEQRDAVTENVGELFFQYLS